MTTIREKFITTHRSCISLTEDFTFKAVFGRECSSSTSALIDLLNVILDLHGDDAIRSVTLKNPYIPGDTMITERDRYYIKLSENRTIMRERIEKATAAGEKIGEAQGRKAEQRDIAANMLSLGIEIDTIAKATGLTEDEIRNLQ